MSNAIAEQNAAALVRAIQSLNETVGGWATFTPTARRRARAVYNFSYEVATGRIVAFRTGQVAGANGDSARAEPGVAHGGRVTVAFDFARLPDLRPGQRLGRLIEVVDLECLGRHSGDAATRDVFTLTRLRANELLAETRLD